VYTFDAGESDLSAAQREHWQRTYTEHPGMYGTEPSRASPVRRRPLELPDASVDAVYAHMLLCMALSTAEIHAAVAEAARVRRRDRLRFA
jgi:hypothetical protein